LIKKKKTKKSKEENTLTIERIGEIRTHNATNFYIFSNEHSDNSEYDINLTLTLIQIVQIKSSQKFPQFKISKLNSLFFIFCHIFYWVDVGDNL
jgi:hypothetical protein